MSEQIHTPQSPIESLEQALAAGEHGEAATAQDFQELRTLFDKVVDANHYAGRYPEHREMSSSVHLRHQGEPADAPRIRVVTDPQGEGHKGSNFAGTPTLGLQITQGYKSEYKPAAGSWSVHVDVMERNGEVLTSIVGGHNPTRNSKDRQGFEFNTGWHPQKASRELIQWVGQQVGDPETLVPAPTKAELRSQRTLGRLGLK